jgi:hypothetical protein
VAWNDIPNDIAVHSSSSVRCLMAWQAKVGRHVVYLQQKTVGGNANYVKRRPAVITGFASDAAPRLRVRRTGEVYGDATNGVVRKTGTTGDATVGRFVSW